MQKNTISFKGQKIFVGIDVHKKTWSVTALTEAGLKRTLPQKASATALFEFLNRNYPGGEYKAVYEAGFSGFSTYYALKSVGIDCIVINAADVPTSQYESVMKSDSIDSEKLARALRAETLRGIYIREKDNLDDRSLVRVRKGIQAQLSAYKHRVKHLLLCNGVEIPEGFDRPNCCWSKAFMRWLKEDVTLLSSARTSLDTLIMQVESTRINLLKATLAVRHLSQDACYRRNFDLLTSIPGIGCITAMTILTEIYDVKRFRNEREFASYLGLIPTCHSSGDKVMHGEKTFRGNKQLGPMLTEACWVAIRTDLRMASAYGNFKMRMTPQEAIVRIARKMSNVIYAVLKTGQEYVPLDGKENNTAE